MNIWCKTILIASTIVPLACNEESDRFEQLDKLRAIGTNSNPLIGRLSTDDTPSIMTLTFYATLPLGETATATAFTDDKAKYSIPAPLTLVTDSQSYVDYNGFRLFSVQATTPLPKASTLDIPVDPGFLRFRYGLTITSGDEEEKVVGNFLVYPEGAPETSWASPTVDIETLTNDQPVSGTQELKASINNPIGEKMRVGWYVSGGKVTNRRAKETEWETPGAGSHTVLVTVRGLKSGAFAMKALDVPVE